MTAEMYAPDAHESVRQALPPRPFRDRAEAGRLLGGAVARALADQRASPERGRRGVIVLGLARGGVPVAAEVARSLRAPLDVLVVRKLGVPSQPELGFGAIAENDATVIDEETVTACALAPAAIERVRDHERRELSRRARMYRGDRPLAGVRDKNVVLVDDGLATGVTMRAAVALVTIRGAARVTVAVPVGAPDSLRRLQKEADVVCLHAPYDFSAVGLWYEDFEAPTDDEIRALLRGRAAPA